MAFVWNEDEADLDNVKNYVGYIIQTIENHNPSMERVLHDLKRLFEKLRNMD